MGVLPREVLQRLVVLYIIERFDEAVYGSVRLHKVAYFALKKVPEKPLAFVALKYGEFSPDIRVIVEQLASMGYIVACPLNTGIHGNQYLATSRAMVDYHAEVLDKFSATLRKSIDESITEYGYLKQDNLLQFAETDELYLEKGFGDLIFESNLPEEVDIPGLDGEDAEELAFALEPEFVCAANRIIWALKETAMDFDKVEEVDGPP